MKNFVQISPDSLGILIFIILCGLLGTNAQPDKVEYVYLYRRINWCVTGKTEPAFFQWPFVQFKPFLLKTHELYKYEDFREIPDPNPNEPETPEYEQYKVELEKTLKKKEEPAPTYNLNFSRIQCKDEPYIGLYDNGTDKENFGLSSRLHVELKVEYPKGSNSTGIEGLLIQANHAPFGLGGFPYGEFDDGYEIQCNCTFAFAKIIPCLSRPDFTIYPPTIAVFHYKQRKYYPGPTPSGFPKEAREIGKQKEFHFNWKFPRLPYSPASNLEFWVLIIHDFYRRKFEVKKFGPYSWQKGGNPAADPDSFSKAFSDAYILRYTPVVGEKTYIIPSTNYIPSPIFPRCRGFISPPNCVDTNTTTCMEVYNINCHKVRYIVPALTQGEPKRARLRFNGEFDTKCLQKYKFNRAYRQCPEWTGKVRIAGTYSSIIASGTLPQFRKSPLDPFFPKTMCLPCDYEPTTPQVKDEGPPFLIFRRTLHSTLMIIAFLFILPVSILIGRFYKETLHYVELKGWKLWLWLHAGISIFLMLVAYASYNLPTFWLLDAHMYWGYGALFSGLAGLISGWGRHKSEKGFKLTLLFHALTGYTAWICAGMSYRQSRASRISKYFVYATFVGFIAVMIGFTVHICKLDKKLGLKPSRSHCPIVQTRFEDAYLDGQKKRKKFLYIFIGVLFLIILVTFFV